MSKKSKNKASKRRTQNAAPQVTVGVAYTMDSNDGTPCHIIDALVTRMAPEYGLEPFDSGTGFYQGGLEFVGAQQAVDRFSKSLDLVCVDLQVREVDASLQVRETNNWNEAS